MAWVGKARTGLARYEMVGRGSSKLREARLGAVGRGLQWHG